MHSLDKQIKKMPKNLNLLSIRFPMAAIMSIAHRLAGVLLFVTIPWFIYIFRLSLHSEAGFIQAQDELHSPVIYLFCLLVIWALAHHFLAGIRYLLLDIDIGIEKEWAQKTALAVMLLGFLVFLFFLSAY